MSDLYEFTVEWLSTTAQSVIVTGDFDKWSKSLQLSRSAKDTFTATIRVPYGCPTRYKFIVDGEWAVKPDQPTEYSPEGYLNNIHYVPLKVLSTVKHSANMNVESTNGAPAQSLGISDLKDTVVASAGTSGALAYVASGIGETVRSVVGVDPFNSNQIAIPTPISPSTSIGFPPSAAKGPGNATTPNTESATSTTGTAATSSGSASIAPLIPIGIVPVYAKENCTIDPFKVIGDEESIGTFVGVRPILKNDSQAVVEKEEEGDTQVSLEDPAPPPPVDIAGPPAHAEEVTKAEAPKEDPLEAVVPAKEANPPPAEPASVATSESAVKERAPTPEEPSKRGGETTASVLTPKMASVTPAEPTTNGHAQDPSSAFTKVASSSRPTTLIGTSVPEESVTSTPASTVRKSRVFSLGKGSLSKASTKDGSTDEFGVQDGQDTVGKKKRKSSIFRSLKKLFHHEHHEKDRERGKNQ